MPGGGKGSHHIVHAAQGPARQPDARGQPGGERHQPPQRDGAEDGIADGFAARDIVTDRQQRAAGQRAGQDQQALVTAAIGLRVRIVDFAPAGGQAPARQVTRQHLAMVVDQPIFERAGAFGACQHSSGGGGQALAAGFLPDGFDFDADTGPQILRGKISGGDPRGGGGGNHRCGHHQRLQRGNADAGGGQQQPNSREWHSLHP